MVQPRGSQRLALGAQRAVAGGTTSRDLALEAPSRASQTRRTRPPPAAFELVRSSTRADALARGDPLGED